MTIPNEPGITPCPRHKPRRETGEMVISLLGLALLVLVWEVPGWASLYLPVAAGAFCVLAVLGAFFYVHVYRVPLPHRKRLLATLRLRPPGAAGRWILPGILAWLLFVSSFAAFYLPLIGFPKTPSFLPKGAEGRAFIWIPLLLLAAGLAPVVEEFGFRGWIQRPLERRVRPAWAIGITAVLFALAHVEPYGFPIRLLMGVALGYAVYASRSIWTGVLLHAVNNSIFVLLSSAFSPDREHALEAFLCRPAVALMALVSTVLAGWALIRIGVSMKKSADGARRRAPGLVCSNSADPRRT